MFLLSGWLQSAAYSLLLGDSLLSDRTTWGHLWGRQVDLFCHFYHCPIIDHDCHNSQNYNRCSLHHCHPNTWDWQVDLIVSILPSAAKDELSLFSRYKLNNIPLFDQLVSLIWKSHLFTTSSLSQQQVCRRVPAAAGGGAGVAPLHCENPQGSKATLCLE